MITPKSVESGKTNGITTLTITCGVCGEDKTIELTDKEYVDYFLNGMKIQYAMPNQSVDAKELCISGTCGKCFDKLFKEEEE